MEYISGIYGSITAYMKKTLKGLPDYNKVNDRIVKNLLKLYMLYVTKGYKPVKPVTISNNFVVKWESQNYTLAKKLQEDTGVSRTIVHNFLNALYVLSKEGKIEYKFYNPLLAKETGKNSPSFFKDIGKKFSLGVGFIPILITAAGLLYIYTYLPKNRS